MVIWIKKTTILATVFVVVTILSIASVYVIVNGLLEERTVAKRVSDTQVLDYYEDGNCLVDSNGNTAYCKISNQEYQIGEKYSYVVDGNIVILTENEGNSVDTLSLYCTCNENFAGCSVSMQNNMVICLGGLFVK